MNEVFIATHQCTECKEYYNGLVLSCYDCVGAVVVELPEPISLG
jgi:hypothetical protein